MIKVLIIGDVVSQAGCDILREKLPEFKKANCIDMVIANGENSAVGNGILPFSADFLFKSGVDIITTGNHVYQRREIYNYLDENPQVIRPANYPKDSPGSGFYIYDGGRYTILVINLQGISFMEPLDNPFLTADEILEKNKANLVFVDFHAEATGEKKALGYYLDGRATVVFGTHTHIQTADEQILPKGTGYVTDVGMTGPINSVLGIQPECIISRFKTHLPTRFEIAEGGCQLDGIIAEADEKSGRCLKISRISLI